MFSFPEHKWLRTLFKDLRSYSEDLLLVNGMEESA